MLASVSEAHRLKALRSHDPLDPVRDPVYDQITALAAALCETPIAFISVADGERHGFQSLHGADWHSTGLVSAFSAHAIEQRGLFVVEDASSDPRFASDPLVWGEAGLRFYAGMPLIDASGAALGVLAVMDPVSRRPGEVHLQALRALAAQVVAQLESRRQRDLEDAPLPPGRPCMPSDPAEMDLTQQAVHRREERFRHVSRVTTDAIWDWDLATDELCWNEGIESLFGHPVAQLAPGIESWTSHIHPGDLVRVKSSIEAVIAGTTERWAADYRFARADGSYAEVHDRGAVIRDDRGRPLRMVGGMSDLSEQRRTERQLRQQAALLDAAQDAIMVCDLEGRIDYWSRGAERLFGWRADEVAGQHAAKLLAEDEAVAAHSQEELLRHGEWQAVVQCRARDGRRLCVDVRLTLLRDATAEPEAMLAIKTDVTQRVALQAQLQRAQRLEAVGQLTGGVAHDFNNLLTVIQGNAELLAEELTDQAALAEMARMVMLAAGRGAQLTQRLLAFARKQPLQPQSVDGFQLLVGMDALLRRTLPADIDLELVRPTDLWPMLADPVQVESAVLNLVLNARDAMPGGGKITLTIANARIDGHFAELHVDVLPGQYVLLSVSDTGVGMSAADLARAFEPFFTTKGPGKGSGLGLSMVHGFARQSHGHVELSSEPGKGTTAQLYLPRADTIDAPNTTAAVPRANDDLRGSATVLIAEDDDLVRRFATELLRGLGYKVLEAENGVAALALLHARPDVELLFTDVVMPGGLNGRQLADAALALRPAMKVLFTSGYAEDAIVHHGRLDRGVQLLTKPYRAVDLARKVRALLD